MKKFSILTIVYIFIVIAVIYSSFVSSNQRNISTMENRSLTTFQDLKDDYSNDKLVDLINDQFPFRDTLISVKNKSDMKRADILAPLYNLKGYNVLEKIGVYYQINNSGYYVENTMRVDEGREKLFNNRIWNFDQIYKKYGDKYKMYIYKPAAAEEYEWFVNLDVSKKSGNQLYESFTGQLGDKYKIKRQELNSIDDYMKEHFKTDHHWNYLGSYDGYKDIIEMISEDFNIHGPYEIKEIVNTNIPFYGSLSLKTNGLYGFDDFIVYKLDDDTELLSVIDGKKMSYGDRFEVLNREVNTKDYYLYEGFYGVNIPMVEYINPKLDEGMPSLLVFVDSFSNAINEDIARHFKHTYFVDPRYYVTEDDQYNTHFNTDEFLAEHDVDAILWIQYYESLYFDSRMYMHIDLGYEND